jgi:hypothetical protein
MVALLVGEKHLVRLSGGGRIIVVSLGVVVRKIHLQLFKAVLIGIENDEASHVVIAHGFKLLIISRSFFEAVGCMTHLPAVGLGHVNKDHHGVEVNGCGLLVTLVVSQNGLFRVYETNEPILGLFKSVTDCFYRHQ